jgi:hypothetical protein
MRRVLLGREVWLFLGMRPTGAPASTSAIAGAGGHVRSQMDRVAGRESCHAAREMPALV